MCELRFTSKDSYKSVTQQINIFILYFSLIYYVINMLILLCVFTQHIEKNIYFDCIYRFNLYLKIFYLV